jgi:hypothetical protein
VSVHTKLGYNAVFLNFLVPRRHSLLAYYRNLDQGLCAYG